MSVSELFRIPKGLLGFRQLNPVRPKRYVWFVAIDTDPNYFVLFFCILVFFVLFPLYCMVESSVPTGRFFMGWLAGT